MYSLKERYISTDPVILGTRGYSFEITDASITRYDVNGREKSSGLLVKDHFEPVCGVLYLAHLLKDNEVKESIDMYFMGEEEKKKYDAAPTLENVLDALDKQLSQLTDGEFDAYYEDCRARHDGIEHSSVFHNRLPFEMQMQNIFWNILDLREGRYHGSKNIRYQARRGIPRIETIGEKLYTELLDLIWRMDNGERY